METDDLQRKYMTQVLGITPFEHAAVGAHKVPVVVECEELTEFSKALLHKILGSVGLTSWKEMTIGGREIPGYHRLRFVGFRGREEYGDTVHWVLPSLTEMLGDGASVAAQKKSAWSLLQQFAREFKHQ